MVTTKNLCKSYNGIRILEDINIKINDGEFVSIMGASGSGKTTLLNCISTIDNEYDGQVLFDGKDIATLHDDALTQIRSDYVSFVFQEYNLLERLDVFDNIALALTLAKVPFKEIKTRVSEVSNNLGITHILYKLPNQLSGGERQRVAFARAFITNPKLLIADEPTGALDSGSSKNIMELLQGLNRKYKSSILLVTHDDYVASYSDRVVFIKDGQILGDLRKASDISQQEFYQGILKVSKYDLKVLP